MIKRVLQAGAKGEPVVRAEFRLVGEHLASIWRADDYRLLILDRGLTAVEGGVLRQVRPQDGLAFWEALDLAYARSSTVWIEPG